MTSKPYERYNSTCLLLTISLTFRTCSVRTQQPKCQKKYIKKRNQGKRDFKLFNSVNNAVKTSSSGLSPLRLVCSQLLWVAFFLVYPQLIASDSAIDQMQHPWSVSYCVLLYPLPFSMAQHILRASDVRWPCTVP
jgi:hypothetical protein